MAGSPITHSSRKAGRPAEPASVRTPRDERALVADIGGTNARFALVSLGGGRPTAPRTWRTGDFAGLAEAARRYLDEAAPDGGIRHAMIAVAAPATGDEVKVTNCDWRFSIAQVRRELGLETLSVINDFAANSWAIAGLEPKQSVSLGGPARASAENGVFAVVGPGTGLGVGAIVGGAAGPAIISSEGGHVDFAPVGEEEEAILGWLKRRHHRVSYERLLCGPGLLNIYHAIGGSEALDAPEAVTRRRDEDPAAARAIRIFCEVLGSFAGNVALTFGAWNGVYLAGGMLAPLKGDLLAGGFRRRFDDKGRFGKELVKVPTRLIEEPALGLIGAAAALRHRVGAA